ncbi:MAG: hypothetical protein FD133_1806 [Erysipelotrichaceae bacterium]|nr:MAG: hypothetical protein FD179_927 [Erysipelotrichaceae bacterium]TXT16483.1 MAG: hypothetical protein FD133_1806 [Erysipelotrichaceae bacterium]
MAHQQLKVYNKAMELGTIISLTYVVSVTFFLILLVKLTLEDGNELRLIIKTITCLHFMVVALAAVFFKKIETREIFLVLGLGASFSGDIALGLKYKHRSFLFLGTMFFLIGQGFYILFFGITKPSLWLAVPLLFMLMLFGSSTKKNKEYDFKGIGWVIHIYALMLILMVSTALASWVLQPTQLTSMRVIGAIFFFFSDFILLHLYFYKKRNNSSVVLYLILYHIGQGLIAWSLW